MFFTFSLQSYNKVMISISADVYNFILYKSWILEFINDKMYKKKLKRYDDVYYTEIYET